MRLGTLDVTFDGRTEVSNQIRLCSVWCPFPVYNVSVVLYRESKGLKTLHAYPISVLQQLGKYGGWLTLENLSRPPSVSSIFFSHAWALLYLRFRASLKGSSHGSSWTIPLHNQRPIQTLAFAALTCPILWTLAGGLSVDRVIGCIGDLHCCYKRI